MIVSSDRTYLCLGKVTVSQAVSLFFWYLNGHGLVHDQWGTGNRERLDGYRLFRMGDG